MPNSNHISIQRCVDFLLQGLALAPEEHEHLIHCLEWMEAMTQAASQELERLKDAEE
jgi:predicted DNA-binding transcriptional regulator YafY